MTTLWNLVLGHLSDEQRVATAVWPLGLLVLWVACGLVVYAIRNRGKERFRDPEMESRGASALLGMRLRNFFSWLIAPFLAALLRGKVSATAITLLSVLLALGAGFAVADGRFALGGWLYLSSGLCDYLDGRLARVTHTAGPRGAMLDSVVDRYVEGMLLVGLCWFYRSTSWALVALLALTGSFLVPYVRARAESVGAAIGSAGFMQRPERVVILGFGTALAPAFDVLVPVPSAWPSHWLGLAALAFLSIGSHTTAAQRLVFALKALPGRMTRPPTVSYRIRRALSLLVEVVILVIAVALGLQWMLGAALAIGVGFAFVREGRDWYGLLLMAGSSALLVSGAMWLIGIAIVMPPALLWFVARTAVALLWIVPNELPPHLPDYDTSPPRSSASA